MASIESMLQQLKPHQRQTYYVEERSNFVYYILLLLFSIFGIHNWYLKQHQYVSFKMQLIIVSCVSYMLIGYAMSVTHTAGAFQEFISSKFILLLIELIRLNALILMGWTLIYDIFFNSAGRYNKSLIENMIRKNELEAEALRPDEDEQTEESPYDDFSSKRNDSYNSSYNNNYNKY